MKQSNDRSVRRLCGKSFETAWVHRLSVSRSGFSALAFVGSYFGELVVMAAIYGRLAACEVV